MQLVLFITSLISTFLTISFFDASILLSKTSEVIPLIGFSLAGYISNKINLSAPHILVAIGVNGCTDGLGLNEIGINIKSNSIPINKYCQTNVKGVYAIGDVTTTPCLAHKASHQGIIVAEKISGKKINSVEVLIKVATDNQNQK